MKTTETLIQRASRPGGLVIYQLTTDAGTFYRVFRSRRRPSDSPIWTTTDLEAARTKVAASDGWRVA